jgi:surface antigen
MERTQIIAGLITAIIIGSIVIFVVRPSVDLSGIWPEEPFWKEWFAEDASGKVTTSKSRKEGSKKSFVAAKVDALNGVAVFDNGSVRNTFGRNVTADGYNLGLKYQCVEFVKRYYYEHLGHKMPDSYGNARDFFDSGLGDGDFNKARGLYQFSNGSSQPPKAKDILVWGSAPYNKFGHVAVISKVKGDKVEVVQQNPGPGNPSREWLPLKKNGSLYKIDVPYVVGWLGKR